MLKRSEYILELAGAYYERLISSYNSAFAMLSNEHVSVRQAAILECLHRWNKELDAEFSQKCRSLIANDCSEEVRVMAIHALGQIHRSTKNSNVANFLANIVADDITSKWVRYAAFSALYEIEYGLDKEVVAHRIRIVEERVLARKARTIKGDVQIEDKIDHNGAEDPNFERHIDWALINRYKTI